MQRSLCHSTRTADVSSVKKKKENPAAFFFPFRECVVKSAVGITRYIFISTSPRQEERDMKYFEISQSR